MNFDIFRVDWILVDSIIIIILLIILCSLKMYKITHRWRNSISNLSVRKITLDPHRFRLRDNNIYIKKWNLYNNPEIKVIRPNLPIIFIFSSRSLHYLPYAILEGLCSYGYTVNHMHIKKRWDFIKTKDEILVNKNQSIVSLAFERLKNNSLKMSHQYWIIDFDSHLPYIEYQSDIFEQIGFILINPSINQFRTFWLNYDRKKQFNLLFSKKSFFRFRNRKIAKFMMLFSQSPSTHVKINVLENANLYFKNNETILLAKLMTILQNNTK